MGRTRKPSKSTPAETTAESTNESPAVEETPTSPNASAAPPDEYREPQPKKAERNFVDEHKVELPKKRNLSGEYKCKTRVSMGGKIYPPGTKLTFTDEQARHYLAGQAVEAVD